jgi:hypothetical protein
MNDIYKSPESSLTVVNEIPEFTFSTLGVGRKIYIGLHWVVAILASVALTFGMIISGDVGIGSIVLLLFISTIILGYAYWVHYAIVNRNLTQLLILIIINIVPFMSPISTLLLFMVRSRTKRELGVK